MWNKSLIEMESKEEDEVLGKKEQGWEDEEKDAKRGEPHISFHALAGMAGPKTMRTQAHIGKLEVTIIVDNDSSLNFIKSK